MTKDSIEYDFKAINGADYELTFSMTAENKLLNKIFQDSRRKLIREGVTSIGYADPQTLEKFDVPPKYFKLINTIMSKKVKKICKMVAKDYIIVLTGKITQAYFKRNAANDWDIKIKYGGQYVDKS